MSHFLLNDGNLIPAIGFGTYKAENGPATIDAIVTALDAGYRHIDTAAIYENEESVGLAIKKALIPRAELFITSKVWNTERGYDKTRAAFFATLEKLQLDYLDLYLIHWPAVSTFYPNWKELNAETWRALEDLKEEGYIRSIGVSNFLIPHLEALFETAEIVPAVNQIEYHPGQNQQELVDFCEDRGILIEAWGPMARGKVLDNEVLLEIAHKYNATVAQLCIQWCLQNGICPLPKSVTKERIEHNIQISFEISTEDMETIDQIPYIGGSGLDAMQMP